MEPQTVPRLRVCTWPSRGSAWASRGRALGKRGANPPGSPEVHRRADLDDAAVVAEISVQPGSREMSISTAGSTSRMLSIGIRVWPAGEQPRVVPGFGESLQGLLLVIGAADSRRAQVSWRPLYPDQGRVGIMARSPEVRRQGRYPRGASHEIEGDRA